jgi:hypothetical protein
MNWDLNTFLPKSDGTYYIKDNCIWTKKIVEIRLLTIIDDVVWIVVDFRVRSKVILLVKHLTTLGVDFLLINSEISHKKLIYQNDLEIIIRTYLFAILDERFFYKIEELKIDFVKNLCNFIESYDCYKIFNETFQIFKKIYSPKKRYYGYYGYPEIKDNKVKDYFLNIERCVKLKFFLD